MSKLYEENVRRSSLVRYSFDRDDPQLIYLVQRNYIIHNLYYIINQCWKGKASQVPIVPDSSHFYKRIFVQKKEKQSGGMKLKSIKMVTKEALFIQRWYKYSSTTVLKTLTY